VNFDPSAYLDQEGFGKLQAMMHEIDKSAEAAVFQYNPETDFTPELATALKAMLVELGKLQKATVAMHWKLKKRVSVPDDVFNLLAEFRTLVENIQAYYKQFVGVDVMTYLDVEKVSRLVTRLEDGGHPIPPQFAVIYFKARALDYVQFNRFEDLCTMLAEAKPYPKVTGEETSDIMELTLEICSVKVINGASAAAEDAGMQKVKDFLGVLMSKIASLPLRLAGGTWEFSPPC
jgi:hypothetical protein